MKKKWSNLNQAAQIVDAELLLQLFSRSYYSYNNPLSSLLLRIIFDTKKMTRWFNELLARNVRHPVHLAGHGVSMDFVKPKIVLS